MNCSKVNNDCSKVNNDRRTILHFQRAAGEGEDSPAIADCMGVRKVAPNGRKAAADHQDGASLDCESVDERDVDETEPRAAADLREGRPRSASFARDLRCFSMQATSSAVTDHGTKAAVHLHPVVLQQLASRRASKCRERPRASSEHAVLSGRLREAAAGPQAAASPEMDKFRPAPRTTSGTPVSAMCARKMTLPIAESATASARSAREVTMTSCAGDLGPRGAVGTGGGD